MIEFEVKVPDELMGLNLAARYMRARSKYLLPAMQSSVKSARSAVASMVPVGVTGEAQNSIESSAAQLPGRTIGKVTTSMRRPNIYIFVMNAGRRPGKKMANSTRLEPWVQAKGLASSPTRVRQIAYLIAKAIQKKGTAGLSFMWRGLDRSKNQIEALHGKAVEEIVRDLGHA